MTPGWRTEGRRGGPGPRHAAVCTDQWNRSDGGEKQYLWNGRVYVGKFMLVIDKSVCRRVMFFFTSDVALLFRIEHGDDR